ncbi:MAG: THUMP-like domain-containing protein [Dehalococcoidia bacterium]
MDLGRARFLVSPRGRQALTSLPAELAGQGVVAVSSALRKSYEPAEAAALAEQVDLRARAARRFDRPGPFLYSSEGLDMLTHPLVAARRAGRLARLGVTVADLTCGVGGDLAAINEAGAHCLGLDRGQATALLAAANVPGARVVVGDAGRPPFALTGLAIMLDPSRRSDVRRTFDPAAFSPPWDICLGLLGEAHAGVLKVNPGIDHNDLPPDAEVEFVQLGRGMREAAVWAGGDAVPGLRRGVLLPSGAEVRSDEPACDATPGEIGAYLFDPQSCVTRAGLVRQIGARIGAHLIDPQVAYLSSDSPASDVLAETFAVLDVLPFSISRLKKRLRESGWRPQEIRRRAFPVEPDELRRLLGPAAGEAVTLLCTTIAGKRTVVVARPVPLPA